MTNIQFACAISKVTGYSVEQIINGVQPEIDGQLFTGIRLPSSFLGISFNPELSLWLFSLATGKTIYYGRGKTAIEASISLQTNVNSEN